MALKLEVVTPKGVVWQSDDVESIALPTSSGQIQILQGHIPLITTLQAGALSVIHSGKAEDIAIDIGYARILGDVVSVLTESAINVEDINLDDVESAKEAAEKALELAQKEGTLTDVEIERLEAISRFAIAQKLAKKR